MFALEKNRLLSKISIGVNDLHRLRSLTGGIHRHHACVAMSLVRLVILTTRQSRPQILGFELIACGSGQHVPAVCRGIIDFGLPRVYSILGAVFVRRAFSQPAIVPATARKLRSRSSPAWRCACSCSARALELARRAVGFDHKSRRLTVNSLLKLVRLAQSCPNSLICIILEHQRTPGH